MAAKQTKRIDIISLSRHANSNNKTWLTNHLGQPELLYVAKWNLGKAKIETMLTSNFLSCLAWAGPRWSTWASCDSQMQFACLQSLVKSYFSMLAIALLNFSAFSMMTTRRKNNSVSAGLFSESSQSSGIKPSAAIPITTLQTQVSSSSALNGSIGLAFLATVVNAVKLALAADGNFASSSGTSATALLQEAETVVVISQTSPLQSLGALPLSLWI